MREEHNRTVFINHCHTKADVTVLREAKHPFSCYENCNQIALACFIFLIILHRWVAPWYV